MVVVPRENEGVVGRETVGRNMEGRVTVGRVMAVELGRITAGVRFGRMAGRPAGRTLTVEVGLDVEERWVMRTAGLETRRMDGATVRAGRVVARMGGVATRRIEVVGRL